MKRAQMSVRNFSQRGFLGPLVGDEEYIDLVQRIDGLDGHIVGIAGTHADDEDFPHRASLAYQH